MSRTPARRMCARCQTLTDDPVTVAEVHSDSGPGWNVYCCRDCAPGRHVLPGAEPEQDGGR